MIRVRSGRCGFQPQLEQEGFPFSEASIPSLLATQPATWTDCVSIRKSSVSVVTRTQSGRSGVRTSACARNLPISETPIPTLLATQPATWTDYVSSRNSSVSVVTRTRCGRSEIRTSACARYFPFSETSIPTPLTTQPATWTDYVSSRNSSVSVVTRARSGRSGVRTSACARYFPISETSIPTLLTTQPATWTDYVSSRNSSVSVVTRARSGRSGVRTSACARYFPISERSILTLLATQTAVASTGAMRNVVRLNSDLLLVLVLTMNGALPLFLPHVVMARKNKTFFFSQIINFLVMQTAPFCCSYHHIGSKQPSEDSRFFIAPQSGHSTAHPQRRTRFNLVCLRVVTRNNALCNSDLADTINLWP